MDVEFGILGTTALRLGGHLREDWGPPRHRALLAVLLVHPNRPVPVDVILDWVWPPDKTPDRPGATLHTYTAKIRATVTRLQLPAVLRGHRGTLRLDVDRDLVDLHRFRRLLSEARAHQGDNDPAAAAVHAREALDLSRGRLLEDVDTLRARSWRTHFERDELIAAHKILLTALLDLGHGDDVLVRLAELQSDHPHDLALAKLRVSALYSLQRDNEAVAYYLSTRNELRADGQDQAAEYLKQHYDGVRARGAGVSAPRVSTPTRRHPRQLPHDIVDFVGRERLLAELDAATLTAAGLPSRGVVILDGMPGVGKTALTVHWGHRCRSRFPGGELFVNLNGFADGPKVETAAVVDDFLLALDHQLDEAMTPRAREVLLGHLLAENHTLIVLDNALDTAHVKDLIPLLCNSLVIVTSRRRLTTLSAMTGARRVRVTPMSTAESATLLATRVRGRTRFTAGADEGLADLCGGLPLVITVLAEHIAGHHDAWTAAHSARLGTAQVLELDDDGDGTASPYRFFHSSYTALSTVEQRLFRLLAAVHPGPDFGVDVAAAHDGRAAGETRGALAALVGANLVDRADEADRYRFHDLIREFAAHRAHADESPDALRDAERRMLGYYLSSAANADRTLYPNHLSAPPLAVESAVRPLTFAAAAPANAWFATERRNLTAALHFAARNGHHDYAWRVAHAIWVFLDRHGYQEESRLVGEVAVSSARADGDAEAEASSQVELGQTYLAMGRLDDAQRCLRAGLRYVRETNNDPGTIATLYHLGRLAVLRGDHQDGISLFTQCLDVARAAGHDEALCWAHRRLGDALRATARTNEALIHLHQAHALAEKTGNQSGLAGALAGIGAVYRDLGSYDVAAGYCDQALAIVRGIPDLPLVAEISLALAEVNQDRGALGPAESLARRAAALAEQIHNIPLHAKTLELLGAILWAQGEPQRAADTWRQAVDRYDLLRDPRAYLVRERVAEVFATDTAPRSRTTPNVQHPRARHTSE
ncbi:tetratricopeptide repeat protein [Actinokineospora sp.]|uniref:tetratricopeptide repeat protein n=1 Tax=Actinokineospora sp. TaxID=1872133 RepID=UPI004037FF7F